MTETDSAECRSSGYRMIRELLLADLGDGQQFDMRAVGALQGMLDAARAQGLSPVVCSAYRSEEAGRTVRGAGTFITWRKKA